MSMVTGTMICEFTNLPVTMLGILWEKLRMSQYFTNISRWFRVVRCCRVYTEKKITSRNGASQAVEKMNDLAVAGECIRGWLEYGYRNQRY